MANKPQGPYKVPVIKERIRVHWRKASDDSLFHLYMYAYTDTSAQMSFCGRFSARGRDIVAYYHPREEECCTRCNKHRNFVAEQVRKINEAG